jgi:hypothetical protein
MRLDARVATRGDKLVRKKVKQKQNQHKATEGVAGLNEPRSDWGLKRAQSPINLFRPIMPAE